MNGAEVADHSRRERLELPLDHDADVGLVGPRTSISWSPSR